MSKNAEDFRKFDWVRNHVKFFRYEDIALNPMEMAKEIYQFTGLDFPDNMADWLKSNTNFSDDRTFSTSRVSSETAFRYKLYKSMIQKVLILQIFRWKHELSMREIEDIQDICGKTLQRLGYNFIQRPEDTSDKNFDILGTSEYNF